MGRAANRLNPHAQVVYTPSAFLVFLALSDPEVNIITPRPGSSKLPCDDLRELERAIGISFAPEWYLEDGLIFPPGVRPRKSSNAYCS
jgi:hypothetical protein